MKRSERHAVAFVRALLGGAVARADARGRLSVAAGERRAGLGWPQVQELIAAGVLSGTRDTVRADEGARTWLRRQLLAPDDFAAQHRTLVIASDGRTINLEESPLARLATVGLHANVAEDTDVFSPMTSRTSHLAIGDILAVGVALQRGPELAEKLADAKEIIARRRLDPVG